MDGSSAPDNPSGPPSMEGHGRTASIGRAFKRLKTALRISGPPKRDAASPTVAHPPDQVEQQQETPKPVSPVDEALEAGADLDNLVVDDDAKPPSPPHDSAAYLMDSDHRERARLLFEKYGLSFEANDLAPPPIPSSSQQRDCGVLRVEKQIRMRIRYSCHRCHTTFGATLICARCEHHRCRKCPRHPPKKPRRIHREGEATHRERDGYGEAMDIDQEAMTAKGRSGSPINMLQTSTSESHPQPTLSLQRASRGCHKCNATFSPIEAQVCANCGHLPCLKCSREPRIPVKGSQPVLDRVCRVPRQRIRWTCDQCQTDFEADSTVCSACLHHQCNSCIGIPAIPSLYGLVRSSSPFVDPDPDPDIQSHVRDFTVFHTPVIIASGSGG